MKKWIIALAISFFVSSLGLVYFIGFVVQDSCLDSGGSWRGFIQGCDKGNGYTLNYLASPLAVTIFIAIVIANASALVQLHSILFKGRGV